MNNITLTYRGPEFELKTASGIVLCARAYDTMPEALEFARGFVSSFQGYYLELEEGLENKFYDDKNRREQKVFK